MRIDESGLNRFIEALVAGQRGGCAAILDHYLKKQTPILEIYEHLFQPALYRIGDLWEANRISVASEHMATAIVELQTLQTAYETSLATAARVLQPTLLDFLK